MAMKENISEEMDDLFSKVRLKILEVRESAPEAANDLKNLLAQIEDYTEKLVVDSLRLNDLEQKAKASRAKKRTQEKDE